MSGQHHRSPEIHVKRTIELFGRELIESTRRRQRGIRNKNVGALHRGEQVVKLLAVSEIARHNPGMSQLHSQRIERIATTARENQFATAIINGSRDHPAKTASRTSEHDL
jgi:hypothetical protein